MFSGGSEEPYIAAAVAERQVELLIKCAKGPD
jgi:hypothetical protein